MNIIGMIHLIASIIGIVIAFAAAISFLYWKIIKKIHDDWNDLDKH